MALFVGLHCGANDHDFIQEIEPEGCPLREGQTADRPPQHCRVELLTHHLELVGRCAACKDRVADPADFAGSLRRVARGGTALDPQIVSGLLADPREAGRLRSLSPRERSVLELLAEGRSNKAIGERLAITQGAVQKHVSTIFNKLGLPASDSDDRRILAVLAFVLPEP